MEEKIKRQKIVERDEFSWEEKKHISMKSNDRCCHCGKQVYTGFGATVDHFIPISKGGTNQDFNMVMLCERCNKDKGNKIMYPYSYLEYLNPEDKKKTLNYFESYVRSFEYIERRNILACDEYQVEVLPPIDTQRMRRKNKKILTMKYILKRVRPDDYLHGDEEMQKITDYFIEYLKRISRLDDVKAAKKNIEFWTKFGCIYYVENANGIVYMMTVTIREVEKASGTEKELFINVFPKNATSLAFSIARGCMMLIPESLCYEQGLSAVPVTYSLLKEDHNAARLFMSYQMSFSDNGEITSSVIYSVGERDKSEDNENGYPVTDKELKHFFNKFHPVKDEISEWIHMNPEYNWMKSEVYISCNDDEYEFVSEKADENKEDNNL